MPVKPLISIITVNLNDVNGLKRTMTSVFEQTFEEFEYIVIDGGSTDGGKEYIETHCDKIDYWVSEKDSGIYNAMNKGIRVANGEYLLFLNSGDHFYQKMVLEENFSNLNFYDFIYFQVKVIKGEIQYVKSFPKKLVFSYFTRDTLPHQATFIKASLFEKESYYDESLKIVSDWKFFLINICKLRCTYLGVDNILSTHYLDGISGDPENWPLILEERSKVLEREFPAFIDETIKFIELSGRISNLRKSILLRILIRLGLLNKF